MAEDARSQVYADSWPHDPSIFFPRRSPQHSTITPEEYEDVPQQPIIMRLAEVLDHDSQPPRPRFFRRRPAAYGGYTSGSEKSDDDSETFMDVGCSQQDVTSLPSSPNGHHAELVEKPLKPSLSLASLRAGIRTRARSLVTSTFSRSLPTRSKSAPFGSSSETLVAELAGVEEDGVLVKEPLLYVEQGGQRKAARHRGYTVGDPKLGSGWTQPRPLQRHARLIVS
jgi:hypothetical protein